MYHKSAEKSAEILSMSKVYAAVCEMTRPANTTPYTGGDIWNDSNTVNPSPFIFQFPASWANANIWIPTIVIANNNPSAGNQFIFYFYSKYPDVIPLDNTNLSNQVSVHAPSLDEASYVHQLTTLTYATLTGNTNGRIIHTTTGNNSFPMHLSTDAKLYMLYRVQTDYAPLSNEKLYIRITGVRNYSQVL